MHVLHTTHARLRRLVEFAVAKYFLLLLLPGCILDRPARIPIRSLTQVARDVDLCVFDLTVFFVFQDTGKVIMNESAFSLNYVLLHLVSFA